MKKVIVGLSGGVDSSVAAYLLKQQGYEVIGLFMKNWHDTSVTISNECPWIDDSHDAMIVADTLGIPFQTVDLSEEYKERIVDYMFDEYSIGRTPNPDVLCNREIKFDIFLKIALSLGADYIATGHYCDKESIQKEGQIYRLMAGKDMNKDQSYFLCQLSQQQLAKSLFPLGKINKSEVRKIAQQQQLITADKKDSQGLCFIGKVKLPDFLKQKLAPKQGQIIEISKEASVYTALKNTLAQRIQKYRYTPEDGTVIGVHQGSHFFTIGQRKGLHVGGKLEPLFVIDTDTKTNTIYVGQGSTHRGLWRDALLVHQQEIHWVREDLALKNIGDTLEVLVRIRYRQPLQQATLHLTAEGIVTDFREQQSAITSGQFVAWYLDNELIGSGVIA